MTQPSPESLEQARVESLRVTDEGVTYCVVCGRAVGLRERCSTIRVDPMVSCAAIEDRLATLLDTAKAEARQAQHEAAELLCKVYFGIAVRFAMEIGRGQDHAERFVRELRDDALPSGYGEAADGSG